MAALPKFYQDVIHPFNNDPDFDCVIYYAQKARQTGTVIYTIGLGNGVEPEMRKLAKERGVVILLCTQDTASSTTLIRCSRTVNHVMGTDFQCVSKDEPVSLI